MSNVGDSDPDPGHRFRFKPLLDRPAPEVDADGDGDRLTVGLTEYSGAHALLRAVYLNPDQPLSRRIRCAIAALPYEVPKLAVSSGSGGGRDFAAQLEAARKRSLGARVISGEAPTASAQRSAITVHSTRVDDTNGHGTAEAGAEAKVGQVVRSALRRI